MEKYLFKDLVLGEDGLLRGPFGSDLKKSLFVDKSNDTYKVYIQENIFKENTDIGDYYITKEYYDRKMNRYVIHNNDFIVTCDGTLGEIYQIKEPFEQGIISSSLLRITLNPELIDYNYFYYLFKWELKKRLITKGNNSVLKHLPGINTIKNLEISLPSIDIQKKIGLILKNIDDSIRLNKKINDISEKLMDILYNRWFLQLDFPNDNGEPYLEKGGEVIMLDGKKAPLGWKILKVKDILNVTTGKEDANFSKPNGKYKFFTCGKECLLCDDYKFDGSAVLVAGNGDFNVKHYTGKFNAYQRTYVLIPNDEIYFGILYKSVNNQVDRLRKGSNGSIVKYIKLSDIENISILVPDKDTYLKKINDILFYIENNNIRSEKLEKLKEIIMPKLFDNLR